MTTDIAFILAPALMILSWLISILIFKSKESFMEFFFLCPFRERKSHSYFFGYFIVFAPYYVFCSSAAHFIICISLFLLNGGVK